ncbi:Inner membrane protein YfdC [Symmachiella dynata]|uniref:Inner membrane protein YfdC n=1 Tax=Symmachiella dynata TaxID=2527995 RepID=A0A517ZRR6_9PLAN|nr:formate/nitrite transporter family protein [Symmachiella dynata]QDU45133.1 Inner membrane protein YfdC [Symmachiella dynata]
MAEEPGKILLPDGTVASEEEETTTERGKDRSWEEGQYIPVIIKRSDEVRRHPDDSLEHAIDDGLEQLKRPAVSLFLSAIAAGLTVGFSAMAVAIVTQAVAPLESTLLTRIATAVVYPLGFVLCVMSGAQLYTEHTATAVYPLLDRQATFKMLLRLWVIVIAGNLFGAAASASLLTMTETVIQAKAGYVAIGHHLVEFDAFSLIVSALLAGWLMALGAWLVISTRIGFSQMVSIYVVTFLIGLGGLHHSIAGSAEMFTALFISDEFTLRQTMRFIGLALFGNLIGGSLFVGVLNYAHIRKTQPASEESSIKTEDS